VNWEKTLIYRIATVRDAISTIDQHRMQVAFVVDEEQQLLGMVTDRDIRRGLLQRISLDAPIIDIMNSHPTTVPEGMEHQKILDLLANTRFRHLPVIDKKGRIVNIVYLNDLPHSLHKENWVVLMVGGMGTRLRPLTNDCPKPMLKVGNKPLLETILENFIEYGFYQFYLSVNYKSEMIEDHFGDGAKWGVNIQYLRENESLGTAGALSLLPEKPKHPLIVMNGDLLTKINFQQLLEFHDQHEANATMCVREYDFQVPYGVVSMDLEKHEIRKISEKPVHSFFVNAGVYVLQPEMLSFIPDQKYYDMPSLFEHLIQKNYVTGAFPIREYWLDIGQKDDFIRANGEFHHEFTTNQ